VTGILLLYGLVTPLVRKLVLSRRETAEINARLRDVEERWRFALDSTGAGVWDLDIPANRILLSSRSKAMLDLPTMRSAPAWTTGCSAFTRTTCPA